MDLPVGPFGLVYADPPWRYDFSMSKSTIVENQYPTMDNDDICAMPVADVAASDAVLMLWATNPKLVEALAVVDAWGFTYRTNMVWVKDRIGMGYYARQRHELLLIATRGTPGTPAPSDRPDSVVTARRRRHSAKPEGVYGLLERMWPDVKRVEMFGRTLRPGWTVWGNEPAMPQAMF